MPPARCAARALSPAFCQAITRKRMEAGKEAKAAYAQRLIEYHHEQREAHAAEMAKKKKKNA